mmetsp:Transcript_3528/g.7093  ORF Transcript_3528/g.7093 Transcript_3528/m.7093 type:complete len:126 (-) Transcript_3528:485-862(-)
MTCVALTGLEGVCTYLVDIEWLGLEGVIHELNLLLDSKISIEHISKQTLSDSCLLNFIVSAAFSRASCSASALAKQVRPTAEGFCVEKYISLLATVMNSATDCSRMFADPESGSIRRICLTKSIG